MERMECRAYWVYGGGETRKVIGTSSYKAFWYVKEFGLEILDWCFPKCDIWGDFRRYIIEHLKILVFFSFLDYLSHAEFIPFLSVLP